MLSGGRTALGVLIVAPLVLVHQWAKEISSKLAAPFGRNVLIHHGHERTKRAAALAAYDFVVTTYDVLRSEHAAYTRAQAGSSAGSSTAHAAEPSVRAEGGPLVADMGPQPATSGAHGAVRSLRAHGSVRSLRAIPDVCAPLAVASRCGLTL